MKTAKELLNEKWRGATNTENYFIALEIIEYAEEQAKNLHKPFVSSSLSKQDADYIWSLMPEWVKDNGTEADAYNPMFFGTLSREGDMAVTKKVKAILFGQ